jgi:hypothetical protein
MSSSDDNLPIGSRIQAKKKPETLAAMRPKDIPAAARDDSSSEDNMPLASKIVAKKSERMSRHLFRFEHDACLAQIPAGS